jgi:hypothetical protein
MAPVIIDAGVVLPWAALGMFALWLINEVRKEWKALKEKVESRRTIVDCTKQHATEVEAEKETRIRISEAVKIDREARHEKN